MGTLVDKGIITRNEARRELGYDEVEGGDLLLVPGGAIPLSMAGIDLGLGAVPMVDNQPSPEEERSAVVSSLMRTGMSRTEAEAAASEGFNLKADTHTDFPRKGDNKPVAAVNSAYAVFDYGFTTTVKEDSPQLWARGRFTLHYAKCGDMANGKAAHIGDWLKRREAWAAKHAGRTDLAGVVEQMQWGVVGALGEAGMKALLMSEILRLDPGKANDPMGLKVGTTVTWGNPYKRGKVLQVDGKDTELRVYNLKDDSWEMELATEKRPTDTLTRAPKVA
jgi:hypothetical protein